MSKEAYYRNKRDLLVRQMRRMCKKCCRSTTLSVPVHTHTHTQHTHIRTRTTQTSDTHRERERSNTQHIHITHTHTHTDARACTHTKVRRDSRDELIETERHTHTFAHTHHPLKAVDGLAARVFFLLMVAVVLAIWICKNECLQERVSQKGREPDRERGR